MRRILNLPVVIAVAVNVLGPSLCRAADADLEYWVKASFVFAISDDWWFEFAQKFDFADEGEAPAAHQQDFLFTYAGLVDWLEVGVGLKERFENGDDWRREDRPLVNIKATTTVAGLPLSTRSRFEYRDQEDEEIVWRYRNRFQITSPRTYTAWKLRPYLADEIFLNLDHADLNKNRVTAGFYMSLTSRVQVELFYFWQVAEQAGGDCSHMSALGAYLRFNL